MEAIRDAAPKDDGLRAFNDLYLLITSTVQDRLLANGFRDGPFLRELDIQFANRYFFALNVWAEGNYDDVPWVWKALLERREDKKIHRFQFAVAGVNAHINFDLAPALILTPCTELLDDPPEPGNQRTDYEAINDIFREHYATLRETFITSKLLRRIDEGMRERAVDYFSHFVIDKARDLAWEKAQRICGLEASDNEDDRNTAKLVQDNLDLRFGHLAEFLLMRGIF